MRDFIAIIIFTLALLFVGGVSAQPKETVIHINTDGYPQETRWVLHADSLYGAILGDVNYGYYTQSNTSYTDTLYIPDSLTNISFVIYDSWGDGIMSPGSYFVSVCGDTIVNYSNPSFTTGLVSNRTVPQCLAQPPPGPCIPTILNINLDQFQGETTWEIHDSTGALIAAGGPYTTAPNYQPQFENLCLPIGQISLTMYDSYGDGLAGSLWGGNDGSYYLMQCNDTLVYGDVANYGLDTTHVFVSDSCPPPPPIFGCMDLNYLEYNPLATVDTGMCVTPVIFGCTDSTAFNYIDTANTNNYTTSCNYTLKLTDLAANGWAGSFLEVKQGGVIIDTFTLLSGADTNFVFNLTAPEAVQVRFSATYNSGMTANQCGFSLVSSSGDTTMLFTGGFQPSQTIPPFIWHTAVTDCGNDCIPRTYGCTDSLAVNYDSLGNTEDSTCYYLPGCTSPAYLEYYTQGFVADYDNGSCDTLAVWGCMDNTAFNYDSLANIDNGGCLPVISGCMNPFAFNYDPLANTPDTCIPFIYGCTDASMFNYNDSANTDDGSCIPIIFGCTDTTALNFNPLANTDNGTCELPILGCTDFYAYNYNIQANIDDSSCVYDANCVTGPGNPYWLNDQCYAWVIQVDPYCCETEWDSICQLTYNYCYDGWTGNLPPARLEGEQIVVYPNPTHDKIYVNENVDLKMFNSLGDIIVSGNDINVLDVSKINPGMYILHIIYNDKNYIRNIIKK